MIDRFGRAPGRLNASASSITPVVPEALSSAPLLTLSGRPGVIPTWSIWAEKTRYSFRSTGSLPSRMPTVFGASRESMTVSFSSTDAVTPGRSRETGRVARRTSASDTPAARSTGVTADSLTSSDGGEAVRSSRP